MKGQTENISMLNIQNCFDRFFILFSKMAKKITYIYVLNLRVNICRQNQQFLYDTDSLLKRTVP